MLRQYLYVSTAPNLSANDVESILNSCQQNNVERGITGLLLYNGRNFLQLLEGEEADLMWVIRRIGTDTRHSGISYLEDNKTAERACPEWNMRHIRLLDDVSKRRAALDAELPEVLEPNLRRIILNFAALN
jgi:hypothetical protein